MTRILLTTLGFLLLVIGGVTDLAACGDKFLVAGRGGAYLRYQSAIHPTRILVYWQPDPTEESREADETAFRSALQEVGHTVEIVKDSESLYGEAASRQFEVIMMDIDDAREEHERLEGTSPDSTLLPVLHFPTRREYSAAKKEFGHAVKTPTTMSDLLTQIEKVRKGSR